MPERPRWLKVKARTSSEFERISQTLKAGSLLTVCRESGCPNIWECFARGETTIMILGPVCTRCCGYCRIGQGRPSAADPAEPGRVAEAVASLELSSVVVTSVTRDDLDDGGARFFAATVTAIRKTAPGCHIELLIPDFGGDRRALEAVAAAGPDVIGHNIETVARLWPRLRPTADYRLSLTLLRRLAAAGLPAKSGMMVGLGETRAEVRETLDEIAAAGVKSFTLGQYLAPSERHWPVARYYRPAEFMGLAKYAQNAGLTRIISGPLVRSSYRGSVPTPILAAKR